MPETQVFSDLTAGQVRWAPPEFGCTLRDEGFDAAWVRVVGELDIATAPLLEETLRRAEVRPRVVLDLRELAFMDCFGLSVIVEAGVRARGVGRRLVVVRGRSQVDRVIAATRASEVLEVVDLDPGQPPVQALVKLAQDGRVA